MSHNVEKDEMKETKGCFQRAVSIHMAEDLTPFACTEQIELLAADGIKLILCRKLPVGRPSVRVEFPFRPRLQLLQG